jgi:glycosyltransferase involved in cell wall biosynthesis
VNSILILSPGIPHPSRGASTVLFFHYIRGIAEAGCGVLHLLLLDDSNNDQRALETYQDEMKDLPNVEIVPCVMRRLYGLRKWTRQPYVGTLDAHIGDRVDRFSPDRIVAFDLLSAAYASTIRSTATRVVWLGDLNFDTFWYHAIYDTRERLAAALRLPLVWVECQQWKMFYRRTLQGVHAIIVASKSSEGSLRQIGLRARYLPYPWPVTAGAENARCLPGHPSFVFFGALSGLGSRSAFHTLLNDIYPRLVKHWGAGTFRVHLAGSRQMPEWVETAIAGHREFVFKGFVDDLPALLAESHAVLVPIAVPVGNRSRILTAMAHGALVIAHRNTAKGNPDLVSGENCLLASSPSEFVEHLTFAVDKPLEAAVIGRRARETYERHFAPSSAVPRLLSEIAAAALPRECPS